jgi:lipopolysaccharide/colanic/teichoic acid biosynthesis glycosyltransferase
VIKRGFDIVSASALLVLALPVIVVAAIGSAIALRAWPFFVQQRVGRDGALFTFIKIRTLPPEAPAYCSKYDLGDVQIPAFTETLRRLHLDELPQLLLVVLGTMSLVGPRPEMPGLHAKLDPRFAATRTLARPGCTGLWQVGGHCDRLIGESPQYDTFYIAHQGLVLDLWILLRTALVTLRIGDSVVIAEVVDTAELRQQRRPELVLHAAEA